MLRAHPLQALHLPLRRAHGETPGRDAHDGSSSPSSRSTNTWVRLRQRNSCREAAGLVAELGGAAIPGGCD